MSDPGLILALLFGLEADAGPVALTAEANRLSRAKQYQAACPLFERVTLLTPERATAWLDSGLCLGRLGNRKQDALMATYNAISLGGSEVRVRKAAYQNLARLVSQPFPSHVPGPTEEGSLAEVEGVLPRCELFDPLPGCDQRVWGCFQTDYRMTWGRFGRDPRVLATRRWPEMPWSEEARTVIGGEVLVMQDEDTESARSGNRTCFFEVGCRVVWADACGGRVGYSCNVSQGASRQYPMTPLGPGDTECKPVATVTGELELR